MGYRIVSLETVVGRRNLFDFYEMFTEYNIWL